MQARSLSRVNAVLLFAVLAVAVLYFGRLFLVPLAFGILLAMLLVPVANRLEKWGVSRGWGALLCILLLLAFIGGALWAVAAQAANISDQLPQIQKKLDELLNQGQRWVQQQFGVAPQQQIKFVREQVGKLGESANKYLTASLSGFFGLLSGFVLTLLYLFFLLWERKMFYEFFLKLAPEGQRGEMGQMLAQITKVAGQYLSGRMLSMLFLWIFYAIGFSIVGLDNALLLSLIAVLPTLIPYVGAFIGGFFPLVMALVGGASGQVLPTVGVLVAAQVLDNNVIEPLVMGARLNLSPFFTIIGIVAGELVWGVPGMILFEPMLAVVRILCSHVPALHPYAFLLEDEVPEPRWVQKVKGWFR